MEPKNSMSSEAFVLPLESFEIQNDITLRFDKNPALVSKGAASFTLSRRPALYGSLDGHGPVWITRS